jgi:hypothetical protein
VLAAARGGRQLPRPAHLNVARRTVRDGNPFPAAPAKFTVVIFLDEQPPARQHLAQLGPLVMSAFAPLSGA